MLSSIEKMAEQFFDADYFGQKRLLMWMNEFEMLKLEHKQVLLDLPKLSKASLVSLDKCKELNENNSYRVLPSHLPSEWTQVKKKVNILRHENRKMWGKQILLHESCEEVKSVRRLMRRSVTYGCLWGTSPKTAQGLKEIHSIGVN